MAALWLLLLLAAPAARAGLAVVPAETEAGLAGLAPGFDFWLLETLSEAGFQVSSAARPGAAGVADAAAKGNPLALLPRLSESSGQVEVLISLLVPETRELIAQGQGEAALVDLGKASAEALRALEEPLQLEPQDWPAPSLGALSSAARAIALDRSGRHLAAWRALEGREGGTAAALREELLTRARRADGRELERARVLAASGDPEGAWPLVGSRANLEVRKSRPDVDLLVAAGEVQLARKNARSALRFLEAARTAAPERADVHAAIGRAHLLEDDGASAQASLLEAARLSPDDRELLTLLLGIDAGDRKLRAGHALRAGSLAADWLDPERARAHLAQAVKLDPRRRAEASVVEGNLEVRLGRPDQALAAFRSAIRGGSDDAQAWVGQGSAQRALGRHDEAETSLRKAVELEPESAPALTELGVLLTDRERPAEAVPLLRRAHAVEAANTTSQLALARALRLSGDSEDAVEVLVTGAPLQNALMLRELARSQEAAGDADEARKTLARAVQLRPYDPELREQAVELEAHAAEAGASESSEEGVVDGDGDGTEAEEASLAAGRAVDFDELVGSFADSLSDPARADIAFLGLREPGDPFTWLRRLTRLREPDGPRIESELEAALTARFRRAAVLPDELDAASTFVDALYAFEQPEVSLSAENIARLNSMLGTDGVFVTRLIAHPQDHEALACPEGSFGLEARLLAGGETAYVNILTASDCVAGGMALYGRWNLAGLAAIAVLLVCMVIPFVRGWGTLVVRIELPDKTKGFFSIFITTGPDQVRKELVDKKTGREKLVAKRSLDPLMRFRKHMAGKETVFKLIPARGTDYVVTVGGPLLDAQGEQIIGHFLEEQRARVRRRALTELEFDFRPKDCAVEVKVAFEGRPAEGAQVAVAGDPSSLRYAREGQAFLYLQQGEHIIRVGCKQAAAEYRVLIDSLEKAVPLSVDLGDGEVLFRDCPEAVEPFLIGDLNSAADALVAKGDEDAAHRLRAELLEQQGRAGDAAQELEAAGRLEEAATLRAGDDDHAGSAELYAQAGDDAKAAEAYRAAGNFEEAAACYERLYDYGNALECWRELGNGERELELLELLGEYFDAAELARHSGDLDRAIQNLQQVDQRHPQYQHACRLIADIVAERGELELAIAKYEESFSSVGVEGAAIDVLESYAELMERSERREDALSVYEVIRRRDVGRSDVGTRIQALREEIETPTQTLPPASTGGEDSRYELLEEIGRGGMGVVYKARDKRLGRIVALKRLPENLRQHPKAVELFEREARAAAALNHANIVTVFDAGEEDGSYFISMELLEGRALNEILDQHGRLSPRDAARIGLQVCTGLQYAHSQRIVHRDIKTSNLFFTRDQVVKIMDFGIAKSMEEVRRSTTVVGGTPYYMAPEQATGEGVDHRADLYALGVTLFQLVTGSLPFSDGDVTYQHANETPPDPREMEMSVPADMAELILQLMAKEPSDRPESAAVVAEALRALLG